jgi:hypothetical protein
MEHTFAQTISVSALPLRQTSTQWNADVYVKQCLEHLGLKVDVSSEFVTHEAIVPFLLSHAYRSDPVVIAQLLPPSVLHLAKPGGGSTTDLGLAEWVVSMQSQDRWIEAMNNDHDAVETVVCWVELMTRLECYVTLATVQTIPLLADLWDAFCLACPGRADTKKLLSFMLACNIFTKHGATLMGMDWRPSPFLQYIFGAPTYDPRRDTTYRHMMTINKTLCAEVNIWVLLLSTSVYNKVPLVPSALATERCRLQMARAVPKQSASRFRLTIPTAEVATTAAATAPRTEIYPDLDAPDMPAVPPQAQPPVHTVGHLRPAVLVKQPQASPQPVDPTPFPCPRNNTSAYNQTVLAAFDYALMNIAYVDQNQQRTLNAALSAFKPLINKYRAETGLQGWDRIVLQSLLISFWSGSDSLWEIMQRRVYVQGPAQTQNATAKLLAETAKVKSRMGTLASMTAEDVRALINFIALPFVQRARSGMMPKDITNSIVPPLSQFQHALLESRIVKLPDFTNNNDILMFFTPLHAPAADKWAKRWANYKFSISDNAKPQITAALKHAINSDELILPAALRGYLLAFITKVCPQSRS